ncbi:uncharacterized protein LOC121862108 isoform X6 [Homarus americanus]|uniref:uncharacterized protein LOC121862108 isoform X6 n=1 Tax=Homarus americanus TaxID=6706 RepID=UPI001C4587B5|nr:uncharacterized protein LOC121862108 isoform X6 [Homarus americanus]
MEKFAVDLDKVLDDFELDEDESESVNQYEKLQLEFCPDGGGTLPPVRHGVGLGTFGGWSEPLQPQAIGAASQPWCGVGLDREAQPPGTRSPPDGQNDDSEPPAACSQPPPSLPYLPGAQLPPPQVSQLHSGDVLDSGVRPGNMLMNQHSATSQALWPVIATSAAGSFSQAPMPSVQAESYAAERFGLPVSGGSAGTGNVSSRVPAMPPDYHIPGVPESSSATSESEGNAVVGVSSKNIPREGFDVIASRPLDVVPASVPPDRGLAGGHETRHPDIIDVWQSGAEASASASQPSDRVRPEVVDHEQSNGESQEVDNEGASGSANCVEQQEHRLLPDLMAMNSVDNLAVSEGTYSGPEYYEPAIVMENALSNLRLNEPAIVMESQSCSRIPEVVNVHQTAEQQGHTDTPSSVAGGTLCNTPATGDMSHASLDGVSHGIDDAPGILQDHINQVCDNVARLDEIHSVDAVRVDPQPPTQSSLPDVSAVGTVPISFSKNSDIDDADLDAELAELEEEQFRLQGAYGGSVARSLTSSQEDSTGEITHPEVQSTCEANLSGGPDLIGGTSTSQPILGVDLGGSEAAQTTGASAATEENPKPEVPAWQRYGSDAEERQSSLVGNPDIAAQENISFSNHPGTEGVEEVICHPHRSQRGEATENYRERDTGDNLSSNSTGTDTMSSSSTLTDGDLGSPERRLQQPVAEPESPSRVTPGALVTAVYDDDSGSGREDDGSGGALAAGEAAASSNPGNPSEGNGSLVGHVAPFWIPDEDAPNCQECGLKFTVIRRRHHCRACGRVLCAQCCHHKAPLPYMDYKEARVCGPCLQILQSEYVFEDNPDSSKLEQQMKGDGPPVVFAVHKNLTVLVKMVKLECCVGVEVWNIATRGLCTVGQEEMVVLLEVAPGETHPPRDIFAFFHTVYQQANQGNLVSELGHTIFTEPEGFLGSREHGGFLYIRPTFQCLRNLVLPPSPYIFAVLIQKWETPWAKVFPLRLMLRMGAEFRYYPCPLVSARNRKPVFCEIGHTIMNLLVDFRNYAYTVPGIEGFVIHMEDKKTSLLFPKNRYEQVTKALSNSNDHVLALGANFSPQADSHLVTIENDDGHYSTQAINIHNRPRRVTGASFIVFNGALKTTSGLSAKSSIVEDGLMVQIPADMMTKLREALQNMKDFEIPCGPVSASQPDEVVTIKWTSDDKNFNIGIKSPVDEKQMDGIPSVKIHSGTDYVSNAHLIRWTEVFIMQGESNNSNDVNLSRLSELLARSFCVALTPHLSDLYSNGHTCLGLRTTIHQDSVGYEAGSSGSRLPASCMNDLDVELIPVIHRAAANITDQPIILELVFHIMEQ